MEDFFKIVLENLPVCTILYDESGKVIYRNKATKLIDGYDDHELLYLNREDYLKRLKVKPGKKPKMIFPKSETKPFQKGLMGLTETTLETKEGVIKNVLLIGNYLYDNGENLIGACGCAQDITEYIHSREYYEHVLEQIISNLPIGIGVYDLDEKLILANVYLEKLLGCKNNWLGLSRKEILTNLGVSPIEPHLMLFQKAKITGEIYHSTYRFNNSLQELYYKIIPLRNKEGYVENLLVVVKSIPLEKEYKEIEFYICSIANSIETGLILLDQEGKITLINDYFQEIFSLTKEASMGKHINQIFQSKGIKLLFPLDELKQGTKSIFEVIYVNGNIHKDLVFNASAVLSEENQFIGVIVLVTDVTSLKKEQKKRYEQEKLAVIGQMAAGMAHEIRNPLTVISGFVQLLKKKYINDEESSSYLNVIMGEVAAANKVLSDFLQYSRPKEPVFIKNSLLKSLKEIMEIVEPQGFLKNIIINFSQDSAIPESFFDSDQIKTVLMNIFQNAMDSMPQGGILDVKIGLIEEKGQIYIQIADTGCGIPEDKLKNIGTPFYSTKEKGTGLGMSISFSIIQSHKGKINIFSEEGVGTKFEIFLPLK